MANRKTAAEQADELQAKIDALKAKKKKLEARASQEKRKADTHNKIVLGGAVLSVLGREYHEGDEERLIAFLKAQNQRGNYFASAMQIPSNEAKPSNQVVTESSQSATTYSQNQ